MSSLYSATGLWILKRDIYPIYIINTPGMQRLFNPLTDSGTIFRLKSAFLWLLWNTGITGHFGPSLWSVWPVLTSLPFSGGSNILHLSIIHCCNLSFFGVFNFCWVGKRRRIRGCISQSTTSYPVQYRHLCTDFRIRIECELYSQPIIIYGN